jgi:hypothetical protein
LKSPVPGEPVKDARGGSRSTKVNDITGGDCPDAGAGGKKKAPGIVDVESRPDDSLVSELDFDLAPYRRTGEAVKGGELTTTLLGGHFRVHSAGAN